MTVSIYQPALQAAPLATSPPAIADEPARDRSENRELCARADHADVRWFVRVALTTDSTAVVRSVRVIVDDRDVQRIGRAEVGCVHLILAIRILCNQGNHIPRPFWRYDRKLHLYKDPLKLCLFPLHRHRERRGRLPSVDNLKICCPQEPQTATAASDLGL